MAEVNLSLSVITLNVNGINSPTKRKRLGDWINKTRSIYMLSIRDCRYRDTRS